MNAHTVITHVAPQGVTLAKITDVPWLLVSDGDAWMEASWAEVNRLRAQGFAPTFKIMESAPVVTEVPPTRPGAVGMGTWKRVGANDLDALARTFGSLARRASVVKLRESRG